MTTVDHASRIMSVNATQPVLGGASPPRAIVSADHLLPSGLERGTAEGGRPARRRFSHRTSLRYLLTGGAGFIGSHLTDALVARGDSVVIIDNLSTGRLSNLEHALESDLVTFVEGSVLDPDIVDDAVRSVNVVIHLASAVGVQLVVDQPLQSLLTNVRGADITLAAAARHQRKLIFASTSEVYGKNSLDGLDEDADRILGSARRTRWGYSLAKCFGEALAQSYHREHDADTVIVRLFNTVGARQRGAYGMVLPRFVRQALAGEPLTVYGNGRQTRCFTHVEDVVGALVRLCDAEPAAGQSLQHRKPDGGPDHRPRSPGHRAHGLERHGGARALRGRLRRRLRGARPPRPGHLGDRGADRMGAHAHHRRRHRGRRQVRAERGPRH